MVAAVFPPVRLPMSLPVGRGPTLMRTGWSLCAERTWPSLLCWNWSRQPVVNHLCQSRLGGSRLIGTLMGDIRVAAQQVTMARETHFIKLLPRRRRGGDAWQISVAGPDRHTESAISQNAGQSPASNHQVGRVQGCPC